MEKDDLIHPPDILGREKSLWTEKNQRYALKKFRQNAPSATTPRLYEAYRWLKLKLDNGNSESEILFRQFIELFLQTLEDRGAGNSEVYSEILRDSAEYSYLKGLFHSEEVEMLAEPEEITEAPPPKTELPQQKEFTLKEILLKKGSRLNEFDENVWRKLVEEHFKPVRTEDQFIRECLKVTGIIVRKVEKSEWHIELPVQYAFTRLANIKKPSLKIKTFAMQLLDLLVHNSELWNRLHREYLEIIRK